MPIRDVIVYLIAYILMMMVFLVNFVFTRYFLPAKDSLVVHSNSINQQDKSSVVSHSPEPKNRSGSFSIELWLTVMVLIFGIVVLVMELIIFRSLK